MDMEITKAQASTQEDLDEEGRAWGFADWQEFVQRYDEECRRLGTVLDK